MNNRDTQSASGPGRSGRTARRSGGCRPAAARAARPARAPRPRTAAATTPASATRTTASAARTAFTACLKTHGVTLPGNAVRSAARWLPRPRYTHRARAGRRAERRCHRRSAERWSRRGGGFRRWWLRRGQLQVRQGFPGVPLEAREYRLRRGLRARPGGAAGAFRPRVHHGGAEVLVACIRRNGYAAMPEPKAAAQRIVLPGQRREEREVPGGQPEMPEHPVQEPSPVDGWRQGPAGEPTRSRAPRRRGPERTAVTPAGARAGRRAPPHQSAEQLSRRRAAVHADGATPDSYEALAVPRHDQGRG